jgi:hypothetical protein
MAAMTYSQRKYMKFKRLKAIDKTAEMPVRLERHFQYFFARFMAFIAPLG